MSNNPQVDKWLDKAAYYEDLYLAGDATKKTPANLAFRRAMRMDGDESYKGDII